MVGPNVLLIHWHDLGRTLGCYGAPASSPNLDRLAASGIRFDNAFSTAPLCSPARGSLFTGRYPHSNGLMGLAHFGWEYRAGERTLAHELSDHGYRTALIGLQHETVDLARLGFQEWHANGDGDVNPPYCEPVTDRAIDWLSERAAQRDNAPPFFLTVGFYEVHRPYPAERYPPADPDAVDVPAYLPDNAWSRDDLASLYGAIQQADRQVGRILDTLDALDLSADTWVIFTTDHGIAFPGAKSTLRDPGVAVSLIMRLPRRYDSPAGHVTSRLISHVDIVPTVLETLGLDIPPAVQGVSHASFLTNGSDAVVRHAIAAEKNFHDAYDPIRCIRTQDWKYVVNGEQRPRLVLPIDIESSTTRLAFGSEHLAHRPPEELYNLRDDPDEQVNLTAVPAFDPVRAELARQLAAWQAETDDPLRRGPLTAPPRPRHARFGAIPALMARAR